MKDLKEESEGDVFEKIQTTTENLAYVFEVLVRDKRDGNRKTVVATSIFVFDERL